MAYQYSSDTDRKTITAENADWFRFFYPEKVNNLQLDRVRPLPDETTVPGSTQ